MTWLVRVGRRSLVPLAICGLALVSACGGSSEQPGDEPSLEFLPDVTHVLEPTDQMRDAAEQQCVDDPTLVEGYVRAVSPDTEEVLAEISVDCTEVRGGD